MATQNSHLGRVMSENQIGAERPSSNDSGARPANTPGRPQRAKAPSPWSVRGVSREARAKAAKAASRRRETLGEWVTNALTQIANEELGSGPRSAASQSMPASLPTSTAQDQTPLGKALLALAERFDKTEKHDNAITALARRVDIAESSSRTVSVMAERIDLVEHRSRALTLLVDRLETADQREKTLLTLMESVAERAERGEERIAAVTRGLADMASQLQGTLSRSSAQTSQHIGQSIMPLGKAVNALDRKLSTAPPLPQPGAPVVATTSSQFYGNPGEAAAQPYAAAPGPAPETVTASAVRPSAAENVDAADNAEGGKKLKFNFSALNERAIKNSQRQAQISDSLPEEDKSDDGGWFSKKKAASARPV